MNKTLLRRYGFVKVAAITPELKIADVNFNVEKIKSILLGCDRVVDIFVFPELCITGYSCGDLFHQQILLNEAINGLVELTHFSTYIKGTMVVGLPLAIDNQIFNCAAVLSKGKIVGIVPKTHIPGYNEFYEERWFASGKDTNIKNVDISYIKNVPFGIDLLFKSPYFKFGIEICEDLWTPNPPSTELAYGGATIILNLSGSNDIIGKANYRRNLVAQQSARCICGYVYVSCGPNESTSDIVFGGHNIIGENGGILKESDRFSFEDQIIISDIDVQSLLNDRRKMTSFQDPKYTNMFRVMEITPISDNDFDVLDRKINPHPFVPMNPTTMNERCKEIFNIQTTGLMKRLKHTGQEKVVIGISGGLDSTLALLVIVKTFKRLGIDTKNIFGITMPGFGTTGRTYNNAIELMKALKITIKEVNIKDACLQHFKDIEHDPDIHDVTYENVQARERTQILMDYANKIGGLVIGTGDLSEAALGWCTYNGDHMSMYSVNCGVPKTLVKFLVEQVAYDNVEFTDAQSILYDILNTPISPELLPGDEKGEITQKTEDIVGPYELHDFFLYNMIRFGSSPQKILFLAKNAFVDGYDCGLYDDETLKKWLRFFYKRFFNNQFKRNCVPDGPKVGSISLSPRGDWRMPSDATYNLWLNEIKD